jgi:zinc transport system substrate-binding protein
MTQRPGSVAIGLLATAVLTPSAYAADLKVVVTSKPIHALVAAVMGDTGTPKLLVDGQASPHTFALKPSGASAINAADVFFRVSGALEPFSEKISVALPSTVTLITLADTPDLTLLDQRAGGTFEAHSSLHAKSHDDHSNHLKAEHNHDQTSKSHHNEDKDGHHGVKDGHVWLDPDNARVMTRKIATVLAEKNPTQASAYAANAAKLTSRINDLKVELAAQLKPVANTPFIVFHDAYQYFEHSFGLNAVGSITIGPDVQPSAKRLSTLRQKIASLDAACVFAEPMFQPKLVAAVTEGTKAKAGSLDPEGISLTAGPELYLTLMRALATNLTSCLTPR